MGLFSKNPKDFKTAIASTSRTFDVPGGISPLRAALNAGVEWPHDCRIGGCGARRCTLKEG